MAENSFVAFPVWHPSGVRVTVSQVTDGADAAQVAALANSAIEAMLSAGFSAHEPQAAEGERIERVGFFVRRGKFDRNGQEVPVIDVYPATDNPEVKYKMITLYLNTPEEAAQFESDTGTKLKDLPFYEEERAMERWAKNAPKFLREPGKKGLRIGLLANPNYNPEETDPNKKKPHYLFNRWISGSAAPNQSTASTTPGGTSGDPSKSENAGSNDAGTPRIVHWGEIDDNKKKVADRLAHYNVPKNKMLDALDDVEAGLKKLSNSKAKNVTEFLGWVDQVFGEQRAGDADGDDLPF